MVRSSFLGLLWDHLNRVPFRLLNNRNCCRTIVHRKAPGDALALIDSSTATVEDTVLGEGGFFRGPWSLCFSRDIFMFVPLLTERRSDGLCLLDHQPSTSGRCCRKL